MENILKNIIPEDKLILFKESLKNDEANFVSKSMLIIDFEKKLYDNPAQDPANLWKSLKLKYRNQDVQFLKDKEGITVYKNRIYTQEP